MYLLLFLFLVLVLNDLDLSRYATPKPNRCSRIKVRVTGVVETEEAVLS